MAVACRDETNRRGRELCVHVRVTQKAVAKRRQREAPAKIERMGMMVTKTTIIIPRGCLVVARCDECLLMLVRVLVDADVIYFFLQKLAGNICVWLLLVVDEVDGVL